MADRSHLAVALRASGTGGAVESDADRRLLIADRRLLMNESEAETESDTETETEPKSETDSETVCRLPIAVCRLQIAESESEDADRCWPIADRCSLSMLERFGTNEP